MNIVLEGPDGAGKSTLAARLAVATSRPIIGGEGPPKSPGEFFSRIKRYLQHQNVIFDRHPCISEDIYGPLMGRGNLLNAEIRRDFFATSPFIVYVRPTTHELPSAHVKKDHESQEHFDAIGSNHSLICTAYDVRMMNIAHYICRRTDIRAVDFIAAYVKKELVAV